MLSRSYCMWAWNASFAEDLQIELDFAYSLTSLPTCDLWREGRLLMKIPSGWWSFRHCSEDFLHWSPGIKGTTPSIGVLSSSCQFDSVSSELLNAILSQWLPWCQRQSLSPHLWNSALFASCLLMRARSGLSWHNPNWILVNKLSVSKCHLLALSKTPTIIANN